MRATESFLLACLRFRRDHDSSARLQEQSIDNVNWRYLFWLADVHGVLPLLYWALRDETVEGVSDVFNAQLSEYFKVSSLRNRLLFGEFRKLVDLFAEHNIDCIALKGITLASTLYEDPALRQFADLDLLVREPDIDRARRLLQQHGFHPVYSHGLLIGEAVDLSPFQDGIFREYYHQYELNSADGLIYIDLHWRLSPRVYPADVNTELAWRFSVSDVICDRDVKVLSDELKLVYLCVHGAKDGWSQIKWIVDADRLINARPELDWAQMFAIARSCGCQKMLAVGLVMSRELLDTRLPAVASEYVSTHRAALRTARRLSRRVLRSPESGFRVPCIGINHTYLYLCDSLSDRIRHIYRVLTYPQARDCNTLGLSERLLPVWPWLRPMRILAHCLRRSLSRVLAHGS